MNTTQIIHLIPSDNFTKDDDPLLAAVIRAGIDWALSDAS
ncbi:hypothetical protein [Klebsiella phage vB_KpnS-VAC5]|nr:hypothetical protein [Klebsiella phage vB_KpnS-VAC5]